MPFYYSPNKKAYQLVAKLGDTPGVLGGLLQALGTKVNLVLSSSYTNGDGTAFFVGVAEPIKESVTEDSIRALMAKVPSVIECAVWGSREGLLVDWFHIGYENAAGEGFVLLPLGGLALMLDAIAETFESGGEALLYIQARTFAEARIREIRPIFAMGSEVRMDEALHAIQAQGYGLSDIAVEDSGHLLRVEVKDCFECSRLTMKRNGCSFMRGLVTGAMNGLMDTEFESNEVKCRLRGDECCLFVLSDTKPRGARTKDERRFGSVL